MGKNTREVTPPFPSPNCLITKAALQAIPNNTFTKVLFDTVISSYRIGFNVGTNDISIFEDGIYQLGFYGVWAANAVGIRDYEILVNGIIIGLNRYSAVLGSSQFPMGLTLPPIVLLVNDVVSAQVLQNRGSSLNFVVGSPYPYPLLSVVKLSGLTT